MELLTDKETKPLDELFHQVGVLPVRHEFAASLRVYPDVSRLMLPSSTGKSEGPVSLGVFFLIRLLDKQKKYARRRGKGNLLNN